MQYEVSEVDLSNLLYLQRCGMRLVRLICLTCTYTEMWYEVGEVDLSNLYLHRDAARGW